MDNLACHVNSDPWSPGKGWYQLEILENPALRVVMPADLSVTDFDDIVFGILHVIHRRNGCFDDAFIERAPYLVNTLECALILKDLYGATLCFEGQGFDRGFSLREIPKGVFKPDLPFMLPTGEIEGKWLDSPDYEQCVFEAYIKAKKILNPSLGVNIDYLLNMARELKTCFYSPGWQRSLSSCHVANNLHHEGALHEFWKFVALFFHPSCSTSDNFDFYTKEGVLTENIAFLKEVDSGLRDVQPYTLNGERYEFVFAPNGLAAQEITSFNALVSDDCKAVEVANCFYAPSPVVQITHLGGA